MEACRKEPKRININIPNSRHWIKEGIKKYCGNDDPQWMQAYEEVAEWAADNKGRGLLLHGNCGLGKSLLATKIIPRLAHWAQKKLFTIYDAQDINKRVDECKMDCMAVLDDIGQESEINEYGNKRMAFPEIVNNAEIYGHILVITTNLDMDALLEKYGDRTLDRLVAITKFVKFEGKSFRR